MYICFYFMLSHSVGTSILFYSVLFYSVGMGMCQWEFSLIDSKISQLKTVDNNPQNKFFFALV